MDRPVLEEQYSDTKPPPNTRTVREESIWTACGTILLAVVFAACGQMKKDGASCFTIVGLVDADVST